MDEVLDEVVDEVEDGNQDGDPLIIHGKNLNHKVLHSQNSGKRLKAENNVTEKEEHGGKYPSA